MTLITDENEGPLRKELSEVTQAIVIIEPDIIWHNSLQDRKVRYDKALSSKVFHVLEPLFVSSSRKGESIRTRIETTFPVLS